MPSVDVDDKKQKIIYTKLVLYDRKKNKKIYIYRYRESHKYDMETYV